METSFIELLKTVNVDCKDDGKVFTGVERLAVVEQLLKDTEYKLVAHESLALIYAKREFGEGDSVVLVSSHVDCLYESCFCIDEGDCLRGTFDNSFGNAAILYLMTKGVLPDNVVVAFTGDEERDSQGAVQTVLALGRMQCSIKFALVLDVTNTGWLACSHFALENDLGIDMLTAHRLVDAVESLGVEYSFKHDAEPDETWDYNDYGIPALSLCIPAKGDLHSDSGVLLRKSDFIPYCNALETVVNAVGR